MATRKFLVPIAVSVAAFTTAPSQAAVPPPNTEAASTVSGAPNSLGGLVLDHATQPFTRVAAHASHASHVSHASHTSSSP